MGATHGFATRHDRSLMAPPQDTPWLPFSRDMLESLAWRQLSRAGMQVVMRICIEHMSHGAKENGRLAVSFDEFEAYGIRRGSIRKALAEAEELGFIRCTMRGRRAYGADPGRRGTYRLTFVGVVIGDGAGPASNEWRAVKSNGSVRLKEFPRLQNVTGIQCQKRHCSE
jgi:hypothetical protein